MPSAKRRPQLSVIQRLLDEPYRFDLVQALRIVELWLRQNGIPQAGALPRYVRFRNSLSMSFPPSQIEALLPVAERDIDSDQALQAALMGEQLRHLCITPAFMGFFGVNGVLPNHYTDGIASQVYVKKYEGSRAFFDVFFNRFMVLHYQAWAKYRILHRVDEHGDGAILSVQLALAGGRQRVSQNVAIESKYEICDQVLACYASMLRHRPTSAHLIEGVLTEYFCVPVKVEQFVGAWDVLGDSELCKPGIQNATLGQGAILGTRCWGKHKRVRLHIGPLAKADYEQFLPGANGIKALTTMLALFPMPGIEFEMRLILRAADVKPVCLLAPYGARLGMGAFLVTKPETIDRGDMVFALQL